jgi:hypothetical protein
MFLSKKFLLPAVLMTLSAAAHAQFNTALTGAVATTNWTIYIPPTPPTLPTVETRIGSYDKSIGNSWLGGSVHAYAGTVRQKQGTYELGHAAAELRGVASILQYSKEVAEIVGDATNVMNNGVQNRSGYFRVDVLGYSVINASFQNNSTFAAATSTFNLFGSSGVSADIPVGPVTVSVRGNAGCGFSRSANWLLPAASASVGLNASGSAHAFADIRIGVGIPGFGLGVGLNGKILEQTLAANVNADAVWGLTGGVTYTLKAITLRFYVWAQALYTWTKDLTTWSAGSVTKTLI